MVRTERSEEELAFAARQGEENAFAQLVSRLLPGAQRKAMRLLQNGVELEDLMQEGMIGLLDAVRTFDGSVGSPFRTFASLCMENRMISACRAVSGLHQRVLRDSVCLEDQDPENFLESDGHDPENAVVQKEAYHALVEKIVGALSDFEHQVWTRFLQGYSYGEIAGMLCCEEKAVDNAMQRVRRKLRAVVDS